MEENYKNNKKGGAMDCGGSIDRVFGGTFAGCAFCDFNGEHGTRNKAGRLGAD